MASRPPRRRDDGPVALVLAGGGARGAYEAGVLSVLLPPLWQDVEFPPGHEVVSLPGGGGLDAKADRV